MKKTRLNKLKPILFACMLVLAAAAKAEDTPFSVVTRCESADKESVLTVERRVLDIYSSKARFEDRILRDGEAGAVAVRSVRGSVIVYTADSGSLHLVQNHGSMQLTNASGAYTLQGRAEWIEDGAASPLSGSDNEDSQNQYSCVTYDHL